MEGQVAGAEWTPLYHEYRCYKAAYPWTTLIISLSQMYALYCLVHFYHGTDKPLKQIKPFAKFISIKLIVFFSYWQGIILNAMNGNGMLDWVAVNSHLCEADKTDPDKCDAFGGSESISVGIQAVLICIEMFVAAFARECKAAPALKAPSFRESNVQKDAAAQTAPCSRTRTFARPKGKSACPRRTRGSRLRPRCGT